ncbi:PhzF family phenazine biosynthesis isomerase [Streptomyces sp. 3MP-14]|uniref:PhzF family phenazine biosynthesis isomerase n=1 Tax=Streptomyces mimosae TaxID=2586635 RepID=A0A5N6A8D6_9ACTN|nr:MULTISPECIES: PhzF family phenazine biosynthesis protein [Streptomyces]KAB8164199.1 PhzF family phenazine biosynthesis isomerase [Streptomyces mimosae]KAB8176476.1 PhzF family phenazine biosynthesis isomerase [Streptomyces sp. 3MP-14]
MTTLADARAFFIADVFTDRPFGGNQLAVLPEADGLTDAQLQSLAREFNFSESVFVLPPEDPAHSARLRIFTPERELPFAGHPTVGAAAVLVGQGLLDPAATGGRVLFEEGVGLVAVEVTGSFARLTLTSPYLASAEPPARAAVAAALSLPEEEVLDCWYGGVGLRFCYVLLAGRDAVDRAALDRAAWSAGIAGGWADDLHVGAGELADGGRVYARCFVPSLGVPEDPATGSAAAGLVAGLVARPGNEPAGPAGEVRLTVEQGVALGRPSVIEASARWRDGRLSEVSVGGHTVLTATGLVAPGPA